jgi:erythronate-4-phosphate dehydrogenase
VVETAALKAAIRAGRLGAVVLDVWEGEPNIDVELLGMVDLASPHIAGYSFDGKVAGMIMIYRSLCERFGLAPEFDVTDFLPVPEIPRLEVETGDAGDDELLARIAERIYSISRDDRDTRQIANQPRESRGRFFDSLRKNYPVRREFQNTTVALDKPCESLARKLRGIGFVVEGTA